MVQRMLAAVQKMQKELDVSIATIQDLSEKVPVNARRPDWRGEQKAGPRICVH